MNSPGPWAAGMRRRARLFRLAAAELLGVVLGAALVGCRARPSGVITFVDHACFLLTGAEATVLIDPGRGLSAAMVPRLTNGHPPFADLDLILVTHTHSDHFDPRLIDLLLSSGGELVTVLVGEAAGAAGGEALAGALAEHVRQRHPGTEFSSYATGHRGDVLLIGVE